MIDDRLVNIGNFQVEKIEFSFFFWLPVDHYYHLSLKRLQGFKWFISEAIIIKTPTELTGNIENYIINY